MESDILLYPLIALIAFLYAAVGHGGASGYLALMALFGISSAMMRPSALLLNLFVSSIAFIQFYRGGHFRWKLFYPFALASIPFAYFGANISVDPLWYKRILGVCLIFATLRILNVFGREQQEKKTLSLPLAIFIGAALGLISGIIGIGGGIILSPLILLLGWGSLKETAAVSALFIFVNSASGLAGLLQTSHEFHPFVFSMAVAALLGGIAGSYAGSFKFNSAIMKMALAGVLFFASIKLIVI